MHAPRAPRFSRPQYLAQAVEPNEPSTAALERKLETILSKIVKGMEKEVEPKPQPVPPNYISAADAEDDLSSYFDTLSDKPAAKRSMATLQAKTDLNKFFSTLSDGKLGYLPPHLQHPYSRLTQTVLLPGAWRPT
eukprot:3940669-Rhodomonas_salina.6